MTDQIGQLWWEPAGSGFEGSVERARYGPLAYRKKTYLRESEFRRFIIKSLLLKWAIVQYGYSDLIRTANIVEFDRSSLVAISEYIFVVDLDATMRGGLIPAKNAAVALAGRIDAMDEIQQHEVLSASAHAHATTLLPCPPGGGLDINDKNWVFDGSLWVLVDL